MQYRALPVFIFIFFLNQFALCSENPDIDAWQHLLSLQGLDESNLGYSPKGYWTRYPDPQDIPYRMLAFDDLMAEPERIYDFVRVMALSVEDYLHPDYLAGDRHDSLLKVAYYCGVRNVTAEFRDYSASLWAELEEKEPLLMAIKQIYQETGRVYRYNAMGQASDFPLLERDYRKAIETIDPEIQKAVARTIIHLLSAYQWTQTTFGESL